MFRSTCVHKHTGYMYSIVHAYSTYSCVSIYGSTEILSMFMNCRHRDTHKHIHTHACMSCGSIACVNCAIQKTHICACPDCMHIRILYISIALQFPERLHTFTHCQIGHCTAGFVCVSTLNLNQPSFTQHTRTLSVFLPLPHFFSVLPCRLLLPTESDS